MLRPLTRATLAFATGLVLALHSAPAAGAALLAAALVSLTAMALSGADPAGGIPGVPDRAPSSDAPAPPARPACATCRESVRGPALTRSWLGGLIALAAFAAAGAVTGVAARREAAADCRARLPDAAQITAWGQLEGWPAAGGSVPVRLGGTVRLGPAAGGGAPAAGSARAGDGLRIECRGRVRARLSAKVLREVSVRSVEPGVRLVLHGRWRAHPKFGPWPWRAERAGTFLVDSVEVDRDGRVVPRPTAVIAELRGGAEARIRALFPGHAPLVEALVLARTDGLEPGIRDRFARAGLAHVLAISGLHVGLIAGTLLLLARLARAGLRAAGGIAVALTGGYILLLGVPHAAARAWLQLCCFLAGRALQRPSDRFTPLAAAALVLLAVDPLAILDPGFQLSFAGTAGILALRRALLDWIPVRAGRFLRDSLATSVAATLATSPLTALHFGQVAPIGVVSNLAAIPVIGVTIPALALALAVSIVSEPAGRFLAGGGELLLDLLDHIARAAAAAPWGSLWVPRDQVVGWALAATAAAMLTAWLARTTTTADGAAADRPGRRIAEAAPGARVGHARGVRPIVRRAAGAAVAAAVLITWPLLVVRAEGGVLRIHAIDVGQGDALAIRSPAGRWILVDTGPRSDRYDAGRARVVPFLLRHGVRRLEALILTHPDADHIGGARAVLDAFDVGAIVDPGVPAGKTLYVQLLEDARRERVRWIAARRGRTIEIDGVRLRFLHPDGPSLDGTADANHYSVAFRLEYGDFGALFLGDIPTAVEETLVARYGDGLAAAVLKVAHHGSGTSTSEAVLAAARPEIALISVGRHNRYGHPHPAVIERLEERGIRILRTDRHGAIHLRAMRDGRLSVETER